MPSPSKPVEEAEPSPEATALYRFFDSGESLLYVGISRDPDARWRAHRFESRAPWRNLVASRTVEWYPSRAEAQRAEAMAIRSEGPRFNGVRNYDDAPFDPSRWPRIAGKAKAKELADLIRAEITSGRWGIGERIPSLATLAGATGVGTAVASKAVATLRGEGLLLFESGCGLFVAPPGTVPVQLPRATPPVPEWSGSVVVHDPLSHSG